MRALTIAAFAAAQVVATAQPALAAELVSEPAAGAQQRGAFAGARIRVPLGETKGKMQAGLALAPTLRNGEKAELRFGKGVELGIAGKDKLRLALGGRPVSQLASGRAGPDGKKLGVSTIGWVAIGVGALAVLYVAAFQICLETNCTGSE